MTVGRAGAGLSLPELTDALATSGTRERLDFAPWPEFPYRPDVSVAVAFRDSELALHYRVREERLRAAWLRPNDPVWEDSCVELFIAPARDGLYYNFEFSCIGTCLAGVGRERVGRELLDPGLVGSIRTLPSLGRDAIPVERRGELSWELTVAIPFRLFVRHGIATLSEGSSMRANFYKCGDALSVRHYLAWSPVVAPGPDFHRPECFGELRFRA